MLSACGGTAASVREGYAELFSRVPWSLFVTYTTRPCKAGETRASRGLSSEAWRKAVPWHLHTWLRESAIRSGEAWFDQAAGKLRGRWANRWRAGKEFPQWVIAIEPHRDDRPHVHALVRLPSSVPSWLDWKLGCDLWWKDHGKAWFEVPRDQAAVSRYLGKYVAKCGSDAIHFSDNYEAPRMPGMIDSGPLCRSAVVPGACESALGAEVMAL